MTSGLPWGLALSSGVNTYLPLFLLALFARFGHVVHLSPRFAWLVSDQAIFVLGLLAVLEVAAQKFPLVDNFWDFLHTLLRPIAGALAAGATLATNNVLEIILAMLMGGSLAAAAHSTKSSLRLLSTSKSFGTANLILSLGEDAAVLTGTLLSVYAPWVMLGIVILFVLLFMLLGPRILRTLAFDLHVLGDWLGWLWRWVFRVPAPGSLKESLLELTPGYLGKLGARLGSDEELYGSLTGWKRSRGGPRRILLLLTSRGLLWIEPHLFRKTKTRTMSYNDIAVARYRDLILLSRVEVLTRGNESVTLSLGRGNTRYGEMAVHLISDLAGLSKASEPLVPQTGAKLASAPR